MAVRDKRDVVRRDDVILARSIARSLEQQIADRSVEGHKAYETFHTEGYEVGMINGLAALNASSNMAEYSGIVLPLVAEVTPSPSKKGGVFVTGKLGEIAKEAVENISSVVKKFAITDLNEKDIHLQKEEDIDCRLATLDEIRKIAEEGVFLHYNSIKKVFEN